MKIELFKIKNNTINLLKDQLNELTSKYHRNFRNNTLDIIQEQIRGIPEYKIEDWIQEELTNEIKQAITRKINKLNESLEEIILIINNKENKSKTLNAFINDDYQLNQLFNQVSLELDLDEIINQFKYKIRNKLSYYCEPFNGLSSRNLDTLVEDISYDIVRSIRNKKENFQEEYKQIIKTETKKSLIKMRNKIKEQEQKQEQKQNLTNEEIQILSKNLKYSGFTLIQENDRLYVEEINRFKNNPTYKKFNELPNYKVEIRYNPEDNTLKSIDNRLTFSINNNKYQSLDTTLNKLIIIDKYGISVDTADNKQNMAIIKYKNDYLFYYNHQNVTNLHEIDIIIREIENRTPQYYNELLKDPTFKMIDNKVKKYNDDTEEIYFDKTDNKVKINPKTKDIVIKKLRLFGFFPIEKEDGLYLKDLITNEEYKMDNTSYLLTSKSPQNKMKIYTSLIIVDEKITPPLSLFYNGSSHVSIKNNMSEFIFKINNKTHVVHLTETGLKYKKENQTNYTEDEIIDIIKAEFPFIAKYFEQHILKVKGEKIKDKSNYEKNSNIKPTKTQPTIKIPTFYELEFLATTYEIFYDQENQIKIRDINTGIVETDQNIITKATFANIWLSSAGIKSTRGDIRFGETFAFSPSSKELYNVVCKKLLESIQNKGFIDTVELFKFICDNNIFDHGEQIITNLFNTENSTKEINNLFLQASGITTSTKSPIVLSSIDHAYNLAYPEARGSAKKI